MKRLAHVLSHVQPSSTTCAPLQSACTAATDVKITGCVGRTVYDSRGGPTVEVDLETTIGMFRAAVPSGASTGTYEALELRDGGKAWGGKGVTQAVSNVNSVIGPAILGTCPLNQKALDTLMVQELDGTQNEWGWCKTKLGANAILAVSLAICKAGAAAAGVPLYRHLATLSGRGDQTKLILPVPSFNIINGGSHAGNKLAMQEFMIMPTGASSFSQAMQMGAEVYQVLKSVISRRYGLDATNVGDEGGFAPNIQENLEGLDLIVEAIEEAGYTGKIEIAMDVAASEFWMEDSGDYDLDFKTPNNDGSGVLSGAGLSQLYSDILAQYPVASIEDPFDQDDWQTYRLMTKQMGGADGCQIVGDDLLVLFPGNNYDYRTYRTDSYIKMAEHDCRQSCILRCCCSEQVTNPVRVQKAIGEQSCNALLLKVNQIGSVTESIKAVQMAQQAGWGVMTSHRSGETEDTFIADLAVGLCTGQIKAGAPCRSERLAKYNQLLRIEAELGGDAIYAGKCFRTPNDAL